LNDIFRAVTNDRIKQICVRAPTGGGKTTLLEMCVPWIVAQQPGPLLLVGQNDDTSKDWAESRLLPVLEACPPVARLFPEDRHQKRKTSILFPHMALFISGANMSSLQEKSMRYVYGDETWQWKAGMIGEAKKRHHDRWNRKTILVSQGWDEAHDMTGEFDSGEVHEWGSVCECCGEWQKFLWNSLRYDEAKTGDEWDWNAVRASVRHLCPNCEHITLNTTAARRAMAGRGSYRGEGGNFIRGNISFTYSALAVWWIDWADLVVEWLKANDDKKRGVMEPLRQFKQKRLAQVWEEERVAPVLHFEAADYLKADFTDGQQIDGEIMRFMSIDRQRDHFWVLCRAARADGTSRLIWEGKVLTVETIRELQKRLKVGDKRTLMDAQYETGKAYSDCAEYGWTALHGSGQDGFAHAGPRVTTKKFFSPIKEATAPNGKRCRYIFWSNEGIKDELTRLRGQGSPMWEFPRDVSRDYLSHLNSEVKKDVVDKVTKHIKQRYVKFKNDNHLWDCEAMVVAAMVMLNLLKSEPVDTGKTA
jgi:hypothetical protein